MRDVNKRPRLPGIEGNKRRIPRIRDGAKKTYRIRRTGRLADQPLASPRRKASQNITKTTLERIVLENVIFLTMKEKKSSRFEQATRMLDVSRIFFTYLDPEKSRLLEPGILATLWLVLFSRKARRWPDDQRILLLLPNSLNFSVLSRLWNLEMSFKKTLKYYLHLGQLWSIISHCKCSWTHFETTNQ